MMKSRKNWVFLFAVLFAFTACLLFPLTGKKECFAEERSLVKIVYVGERSVVDLSKPLGNLYNPYDGIQQAIDGEGGNAIKICLISNLIISETIVIDNKTVTVDGGNFGLTYHDDFCDTMFQIGKGARLIITNVTIDGGNEWVKSDESLKTAISKTERGEVAFDELNPVAVSELGGKILTSPMFVNSGTLSILDSTVIQNCFFDQTVGGFGNRLIYSLGEPEKLAEVIIENAIITHCISSGGLIYSGSTDLLVGGACYFVDNVNFGGRAGLFVIEKSSMAMMKSGVVIKNNLSFSDNATIFFIGDNSNFKLNGGLIQSNRALLYSQGSNIATISVMDAEFVMNSGIIEKNIGGNVSAFDVLLSEGYSAVFNGGQILDNAIGVRALASSSDLRLCGDVVFGKDFAFSGDIELHSLCKFENLGVANGKVFVSGSGVQFVNTGVFKGTVDINYGKVINSGTIDGEVVLNAGVFENNNILNGRVVASVGEDGEPLGEVCGFCESDVFFENVFRWVEDGFVVVTFDFNGGVDKDKFIKRRTLVEVGSVPVFDGFVPTFDGKVFYGFQGGLSAVFADTTFVAVFEDDINNNGNADIDEPRYTIKFVDGVDGVEVFEEQIYGGLLSGDEMPKFQGNLIRDGWKFWGWDKKPSGKVKEDVVFVAMWLRVEEPKSEWVSIVLIVLQILGLVLSAIPVAYIIFQKYKKATVAQQETLNTKEVAEPQKPSQNINIKNADFGLKKVEDARFEKGVGEKRQSTFNYPNKPNGQNFNKNKHKKKK